MHFTTYLAVALRLAAIQQAVACPGMERIKAIAARQAAIDAAAKAADPAGAEAPEADDAEADDVEGPEVDDPEEPEVEDVGDSDELLGDLLTLQDADLTPVGADIKSILLGTGEPESDAVYTGVPQKASKACKADKCCVWSYISKEMEGFMRGRSGRCTKWARFAVRLGFHDAGTWSKSTASQGGGADGSIILSGTEINRPENNGLQQVATKFKAMYDNYRRQGFEISMADLIQMGANVGAVVCPLGPRVKTYVGRPDSRVANPDNLLPNVHAPADELLALFRDKTINAHGLAALVGAHTTSQQFFVDKTRAGDPQDSTPGIWDVKFYGETTGSSPKRVFKFPSDVALAAHPDVAKEWQEFAGPGGQEHWNEDYAREYVRLSLLGVNNINTLTECTKVLPKRVSSFTPPDQAKVLKWLNSNVRGVLGKLIADLLFEGTPVTQDIPLTSTTAAPTTTLAVATKAAATPAAAPATTTAAAAGAKATKAATKVTKADVKNVLNALKAALKGKGGKV